jgi:hypothetical protein
MRKLDRLFAERAAKFLEVCALLSRELGYGELSTISYERRQWIEKEAQQYIQDWEEMSELRAPPYIRPMTPLRRLLNQYQDICERILDERDIEIGLWAYKRRGPARRRTASA